MSKTIAERFKEQAQDHEGVWSIEESAFYDWLLKQPENQRIFTIDEVRAWLESYEKNSSAAQTPMGMILIQNLINDLDNDYFGKGKV